MIDLLLVDDHRLVREGIRRMLEDVPDIHVVGEVSSGEEFLSRCFDPDFDVALVDVQMPGIGGLEALQQARRIAPHVPCLILSMYAEETYAVRALREGAAGYLTKGSTQEELVSAIHTVASGRRYISPSTASALASFLLDDHTAAPHDRLSRREFEVFTRLARGEATKSIGQEMGISVKTVSTYRSRIFQKLGFRSGAELVRYALDHGLIE